MNDIPALDGVQPDAQGSKYYILRLSAASAIRSAPSPWPNVAAISAFLSGIGGTFHPAATAGDFPPAADFFVTSTTPRSASTFTQSPSSITASGS